MTDMPDKLWVGILRETIHNEISYRCDIEQIGISDTKYHKSIVSKEDAREVLKDLKEIENDYPNAEHDFGEKIEIGHSLAEWYLEHKQNITKLLEQAAK